MDKLINKIKKHDSIQLLKTSYVKRVIQESSIILKRYQIKETIKSDIDFFYLECLILTLQNKELFEGAFVKTFDDMIDYWQTLNYEERKKLVNIDINQAISELKYVDVDGVKMYLPCFNEKVNSIYRTEMVLFELKQYNRLRFDCKDLIERNCINIDTIRSNVTSLEYIDGSSEDFWAYCAINHQIYHFIHNEITNVFPIIEFNGEVSELKEIISLFDDNEKLIDYLLEKNWISEKIMKKINKKLKRG